jgi:hypothetical protein
MEALTRLVADSLARHGLNRPVDPRRLQWSRWSRCDSPHSLLVVPSKPGIFALAEEIMNLGPTTAHVGTAALGCPAEQSSATASDSTTSAGSRFPFPTGPFAAVPLGAGPLGSGPLGTGPLGTGPLGTGPLGTGPLGTGPLGSGILGGAALQRSDPPPCTNAALAAEGTPTRRMLAVLQFSEDDDMAYVLDRMFTRINPMRARLASGRCFLRFVVIEDQDQRRSICTALNQWLVSSAEKASGISSDFASSLELNVARAPSPAFADSSSARVGRTLLSDSANSTPTSAGPSQPGRGTNIAMIPRDLDSGAHKNLHCPNPFPSGF